ncbi:MAG: hypothetical protein AMXMBFR61_07180 [Fimbriimonadales bacterium]
MHLAGDERNGGGINVDASVTDRNGGQDQNSFGMTVTSWFDAERTRPAPGGAFVSGGRPLWVLAVKSVLGCDGLVSKLFRFAAMVVRACLATATLAVAATGMVPDD